MLFAISFIRCKKTRNWDYLGLSTHPPTNLLPKANKGDGIITGFFDSGLSPSQSP